MHILLSPAIINNTLGQVAFQSLRVCRKLRSEPSGMEYLYVKSSLPSPTLVSVLIFEACSDKGQESIVLPRASQRFAEIRPSEYGCGCPGRVRMHVSVRIPDIIMTCGLLAVCLQNGDGVGKRAEANLIVFSVLTSLTHRYSHRRISLEHLFFPAIFQHLP